MATNNHLPPPPPPPPPQIDGESLSTSSSSSSSLLIGSSKISLLLVTANVGSIFEDPECLLKLWMEEFLRAVVAARRPSLIAVHCQEVGGKKYEQSMVHVERFTRDLLAAPELADYEHAKLFLDEDFTNTRTFTALGSLYFIHKAIQPEVFIWNFDASQYVPLVGREIFSGNIELVPYKEKVKFPQEYFPNCKWSRKGFMRTRWLVGLDTEFDLVNIHLFHDASNLISLAAFPSEYSEQRRRALDYTLDFLERPIIPKRKRSAEGGDESSEDVSMAAAAAAAESTDPPPYFIFGDFNFRLDTHSYVKELIGCDVSGDGPLSLSLDRRASGGGGGGGGGGDQDKNEDGTFWLQIAAKKNSAQGRTSDSHNHIVNNSENRIRIGKKIFDLNREEESFFLPDKIGQLQRYDREADHFRGRISEFPITFPPSYPFREECTAGGPARAYMKTRCPSWCDRILLSRTAMRMVHECWTPPPAAAAAAAATSPDGDNHANHENEIMYTIMGSDQAMGDHKPVQLSLQLRYQSISALMVPDDVPRRPPGQDPSLEPSKATNAAAADAAAAAASSPSPLQMQASRIGDLRARLNRARTLSLCIAHRAFSVDIPDHRLWTGGGIADDEDAMEGDGGGGSGGAEIRTRTVSSGRREDSTITSRSLNEPFLQHTHQRNEWVKRTNDLFRTLRTLKVLQSTTGGGGGGPDEAASTESPDLPNSLAAASLLADQISVECVKDRRASSIGSSSDLLALFPRRGEDTGLATTRPPQTETTKQAKQLKIHISTASARLESHHSSSSEEWYSEIGLVTPSPNPTAFATTAAAAAGIIPTTASAAVASLPPVAAVAAAVQPDSSVIGSSGGGGGRPQDVAADSEESQRQSLTERPLLRSIVSSLLEQTKRTDQTNDRNDLRGSGGGGGDDRHMSSTSLSSSSTMTSEPVKVQNSIPTAATAAATGNSSHPQSLDQSQLKKCEEKTNRRPDSSDQETSDLTQPSRQGSGRTLKDFRKKCFRAAGPSSSSSAAPGERKCLLM